jgi:hypothetical protein
MTDPKPKKYKKMRDGSRAAGGGKMAQSGGARLPNVELATQYKKKPAAKLKARDYTTGGGTKTGATVIKGRAKKK